MHIFFNIACLYIVIDVSDITSIMKELKFYFFAIIVIHSDFDRGFLIFIPCIAVESGQSFVC